MVEPTRERATQPPSPGVPGYALAITVSLLVLAVEIAVSDAREFGMGGNFLSIVLLVVFFGAVPAAFIGSIGSVIVHLATRSARSQWPAVALASAVGAATALFVSQGNLEAAVLLGLAAGAGRLAVVPFAVRRTA